MTDIEAKRHALARLDARLAEGEVTAEDYERLRDLLTSGLTLEQRADLGVTPTPAPRPLGSSGIGPSGGRTRMPSIAELEIEPGTVVLDQWRIVRELGRGGFGAVFEAEDIKLGRTLAVKVLDPAMAAKEELLARFRREVTLMRELAHDRIVRVYDYREDAAEHLALITMEYVRGCSVAGVLALARASGELVPVTLALAIFEQTLQALAAAHAQGVIHRDVTPGNILLAGGTAAELMSDPERDPRVKLVDFGIAGLLERTELSAKSRVLGTAAYVAPEVLDPDAEITSAADVYGAGAVAYELLTGKTPMVTTYRLVTQLRGDVSAGVERAVMSAVKPESEDRPSASTASGALAKERASDNQEEKKRRTLGRLREHLVICMAEGEDDAAKRALDALRETLGQDASLDPDVSRAEAWLKRRKLEPARGESPSVAADGARKRDRRGPEEPADTSARQPPKGEVHPFREVIGQPATVPPRVEASETHPRNRFSTAWIVAIAAAVVAIPLIIIWTANLSGSGGQDRATPTPASGNWALVIDMGCEPQDLQRVLKKAQQYPKALRPVSAEARGDSPCWQLLWGSFSSPGAAVRGLRDLPAAMREPGFEPHLIELTGDEVVSPATAK